MSTKQWARSGQPWISTSDQLSATKWWVTSESLYMCTPFSLSLNITNANTKWAAISDPPSIMPLLIPVALLQPYLLWILPSSTSFSSPTVRAWARRRGLFKAWQGLGLSHLVEEGKISNIFPWWRKRDNRGEFVAPQDFVRQVGGSYLASGWCGFHCGIHYYQQFKICHFWVCPASTCGQYREID